jgi:hypothetical protein
VIHLVQIGNGSSRRVAVVDDGQSRLPQNFADMSRREARSHESRREPPVAREFLEVAWHQPLKSRSTPSRKGGEPHRSLAEPAPAVAKC